MELDINLEFISERTVASTSPELFANAGGIALENFIVAIDPSYYPRTGRLLRRKMEQYFNLPVKYLFVSHYHADHVFGGPAFKDTTKITSQLALKKIINQNKSGWGRSFEEWKKEDPEIAASVDEITYIYPTVGFQEKLEIYDGDTGIEFYHVGGHTDCSAYAFVPHEKVLFAGDLIFAKDFPGIFEPTCNPEQWIKILKNFMNMDFSKLIPGHGPIVDKYEVKKHLDFFEDFKKTTLKTINTGKGYESIRIPDFYEPNEEYAWVKESAVKLFYNFYRETTDISS